MPRRRKRLVTEPPPSKAIVVGIRLQVCPVGPTIENPVSSIGTVIEIINDDGSIELLTKSDTSMPEAFLNAADLLITLVKTRHTGRDKSKDN